MSGMFVTVYALLLALIGCLFGILRILEPRRREPVRMIELPPATALPRNVGIATLWRRSR